MNHRITTEAVTSILDSYSQQPARPARVFSGSLIPLLDDAQDAARDEWQNEFGCIPPDAIIHQDYAITGEGNASIGEFFRGVYLYHNTELSPEYAGYTQTDARKFIPIKAAKLRRDIFRQSLDFAEVQPVMELAEPIEEVPIITSRDPDSAAWSFITAGVECAVTVFGMTAAHYLAESGLSPSDFDSISALDAIRSHPISPQGAVFDLPWLLGTMGSEYVEQTSGRSIRTIVSVGADLGELEAKVIKPLRDRSPDLEIGLSAIVTSDSVMRANHALAIVGTDNGCIQVQDPRHGSVDMEAKKFWDRWTPTNLQTVVTIAKPT